MALRKRRLILAATVLAMTAACGSNNASPTAVVPNFAGNWSGTYSFTGCSQSGGLALANICGVLPSSAPYSFSLSQNGSTVSGSFALGNLQFPSTSAVVSSGGALALSGTNTSSGITTAASWNLTLPSNSTLSGTVSYVITSDVLTGSATISGSILSATRSAVFLPSAIAAPRTLSEIGRALVGR